MWWGVETMKLLPMQASPVPCYLVPLKIRKQYPYTTWAMFTKFYNTRIYIKNQCLDNIWLLVLPEFEDSNRPEKCNLLDLQTLSAPTNAQFCILRILLLIFCYMFRHICHPHGASTHVVKTYSNNIVLQW